MKSDKKQKQSKPKAAGGGEKLFPALIMLQAGVTGSGWYKSLGKVEARKPAKLVGVYQLVEVREPAVGKAKAGKTAKAAKTVNAAEVVE